jgi:hypothetical protein
MTMPILTGRKRRTRQCLSLALLLFLVARCGGGGSTGGEDATAEDVGETDAAEQIEIDGAQDADADAPDAGDADLPPDGPGDPDADDAGEVVIPPGALRVEMDGEDTGDCRSDPCRTLDYAGTKMQPGDVLYVGDGSYDTLVSNDTFPSGTAEGFTVVRAVHDGGAVVTGGLELYRNGEFYLQFEGLRFESGTGKGVAGGHVHFLRASFVGGPPSGNTVNWGAGTNDFEPGAWDILCEDCLFYGLGGRYAALVYRGQNVVLRRAVARKDGGWGLEGPDSTGWEPEGVIIFYESAGSACEQCVVLDSLKLSDDSAEGLGALILNSHSDTLHHDVHVTQSIVVNNAYTGLALEGNGAVLDALFADTYSAANTGNGVTLALDTLTGTFERCAVIGNGGDGIADYGSATVSILDCIVRDNAGEQLRGVTGETGGAGPGAIDLSGFDDGRIRAELCNGVDRGFCATSSTFEDYLRSFMER